MASLPIAAASTRTASAQLASSVTRRLLSLSSSSVATSSCGVSPITPLQTSTTNSQPKRSIHHLSKSQIPSRQTNTNNTNSPHKHSLSYTSLRNKVTEVTDPFEVQPGNQYTSPYADFFANINAGRSSLGTTYEMEELASQIQEQYLDCGIPESALRFQTTSYGRYQLAPYVAPGEHRVIVKVPLSAIPFENDLEKEVLLEIVGSRYNEERGVLQLSSEKFASRIENKRHLVGMIEKIVSSARKLAKEFAEEGRESVEK